MGEPLSLCQERQAPAASDRSQVVRARKGGPVISGPRSAAGTRQLARSRVLKDTAQPGASGEKGMSCEPRYDGKSFFSQSMLGMKWFLGGLNGTKTFYFGVDVVTECLSICSSICTSDKQSDKRIIASSTRKLTNCQPNCLRPLASLLKTKCFFCFFLTPLGATKCAFQRFEIPFLLFCFCMRERTQYTKPDSPVR